MTMDRGAQDGRDQIRVSTRANAGPDREDLLDRYRHAVEQLLGDHLAAAGDDDFEALFAHVSSCFERDVDEETCALTWMTHPGRRP
jgi:hypothetical protein